MSEPYHHVTVDQWWHAESPPTDDDQAQIARLREFLRIFGPPAGGWKAEGPRWPAPHTPEQAAYLADPANRVWLGLEPES